MTTHHTAQGLASLGRHGDTMLVHMSPHEVAGLNYLAKKQGTKLTINPDTGLPEAFSLGGFFSSLLPTFVGMAFPGGGMMPLLAGALTGAGVAAAKKENPLMGGLMGGLGGYSGAGLAKSLGAAANPMMAGQALEGTMPQIAGQGASEAIGTNALQYQAPGFGGLGFGSTSPAEIQAMNASNLANQTGFFGGATSGAGNIIDPALNNLSQAGAGFKNIATGQPGAWDAFKAAGGSGMKLAMPIGGAVLGGLEPSDIYGEPMKRSDKDKYDPYATLNLGNDTGLRLYAVGGTVTTGGLRDLYATSDSPANPQLSRDGYGVGRLENLARQQAMTQAQTMGYAMGGPVSFADGGDAMKLQDEITPIDQSMGLGNLSATMPPPAGQAMQANQVQNTASALSDTASSEGSIVAQVANNLRNDPNYQPKNPIEAAIVKQMKGTEPTDQGKQAQGLGSIAPSQPMAPSYNPSVAMGPTYYAGMNAPRGFAEGGETHMNLDALPSLNLNTGTTNPDITAVITQSDKPNRSPFGNMMGGSNFNNYNRPNAFNNAGINFGSDNRNGLSFRTLGMAHGGYLDGQGDGMSDSIPATIEGKQPARLADGEFVVPADVVSHLGNGSSKAGSKRLYAMLDKVRHARTGNKKQGKEIKPEKYMPA
jgi:hypothetical protein